MKVQVQMKTSNEGKKYMVMEAISEWGRVTLTMDKGVIAQVLPMGISFKEIGEKPIIIGEIKD